MPLSPGTPAPSITGINVIDDMPWSLEAQAGKMVLLAFSGITWCPPCQAEAPHLEAVWQQLKGNATPPFTMAIISGTFGGEENPQALMSSINQYGITFPVIPGAGYWDDYEVQGVPTVFCAVWNPETNRHEIGNFHVGADDTQGLLDFLFECGLEDSGSRSEQLKGNWAAAFTMLFGGIGVDGGGIGITPGGKPVPVPPWDPLRNLGPAGREAIVGLAMADMAGELQDPAYRARARKLGLAAAQASIERLQQQRQREAPSDKRPPGLAVTREDAERVTAKRSR